MRLLCAAQALSQLGDQLSRIALVAVLWAGASAPAGELLRLVAIAALPSIAFGLAAGEIADRAPARRILIACDVLRAMVVALFPVLHAATGSTLPIYAGLPLLLGLNRAFRVARGRLLPEWVAPSGLARANGALLGVDRAAEVAGAVAAGVLVTALGWRAAFVLDGASYLLSAALILFVPSPPTAIASPPATRQRPGADIIAPWRLLFVEARRRPHLALVSLTPAIVALVAGGLVPIVLEWLPRSFGGNAPAVTGWLAAAVAAGAVASALEARRHEPGPVSILLATALFAPLVVAIALGSTLPVLLGAGLAAGALSAMIAIGSETHLQREGSRHLLGRWLAVKEGAERILFLAGLAGGSALLASGAQGWPMAVVGCVLLAGAAIASLRALAGEWRSAGGAGPHVMLRFHRLLRALLRRLPVSPVVNACGRVGRLTVPLHRGAAPIVAHNQALAGVRADLADVLEAYARYHAETAALAAGRLDWFRERCVVEGLEHVETVRRSGRGCIFLSGHIGNWDIASWIVAERVGPIGLYTEELRPRALLDYYAQMRGACGGRLLAGRSGLREAARTLRQGGLIGLLGDRSTDGLGTAARLGSTVTRLPAGPYRLARWTGAAVLPTVVFRQRKGYLIRVLPPLRVPESGDEGVACSAMTQEFAGHLQAWVGEHPDQWIQLTPLARSAAPGPLEKRRTGASSLHSVVER